MRCCLHTLIFLGPIGLRLQLAEPNGKQITSHSSIIRGAYWVKITAGKKTAAVLRRRRSRSLEPVFHGACFGAVSAPTLYAPYPRRVKRSMENGLNVKQMTNTDLFTAANPNTISYLFLLIYSCQYGYRANTTTYVSQRTSKLFCRLSERSCFGA